MSDTPLQKKLTLKRCYMPDGYNESLEGILAGIKANAPNHVDRVYYPELFKSYIIGEIDTSHGKDGTFVRIYLQDHGATGLINHDKRDDVADIEEFSAPENRSFLNTEICLYVVNNHVLVCNLGARDKALGAIINEIAKKTKAINDDFSFKIADVPNKTTVEKASQVGVKEVDLSITSYLASLEDFSIDKKSALSGPVAIFKGMLGSPLEAEKILKRKATTGRLILKRGRFKKEEIQKDAWLTNLAETVIDESGEDYKITLEDDTVISTSDLRVTKAVKLKRFANSYAYDHAKQELFKYFQELKENGSLDW